MRTILLLSLVAALLVGAGVALAAPNDLTLVQTHTSAPTESAASGSDQANTAAPTSDKNVCWTYGTQAAPCRTVILRLTHSNASTTCDVLPYAWRDTPAGWAAWTQLDDVPVNTDILISAPGSKLNLRLTGCLVGTIDTDNPVKEYVGFAP